MLASALAAGGCSGGTGKAESPSGPSQPRWGTGEFTGALGLCSWITQEDLRPLLIEQAQKTATSSNVDCAWRAEESGTSTDRTLRLVWGRHEPPSKPGGSATDEARRGFAQPREWRYGAGVPVRGLGDEAKLGRDFTAGDWGHRVAVAVRARNLVFMVQADARSQVESDREWIAPIGDLEAGVLAVARRILVRLGVPAAPAPSPPAPRPGETAKPREVCGPLRAAAGRLLRGVRGRTLSPRGSRSATGCLWERERLRDHLVVSVEVIPPSPATGESATQVAGGTLSGWHAPGWSRLGTRLGDDALVSRYDSGTARNVEVVVRRANLLVSVSLDRRNGAPPVRTLENEAVRIAGQVLALHG
ncbi:hypothetical protein DPM19_33360 [Actinomadura craniellae]|uniref:DUF3558 domain-containing protein n=2 Tax=Actinomadura craniellae TaxID=2231787 RepID=A0A365GY47_9ACTN|nr:hypothetical protein DPM19_33360 [Actinomadura craniellae]